jgi:uncharacterized protein
MLIYLHGFNSSPASHKAKLLERRSEELGKGAEFSCPGLPDRPAQAIALLEETLRGAEPRGVTLVGSSLGGYYATYLAERFGARAVLVNPAVNPYEGLRAYLGPQRNLYTGEAYELTEKHLEELRALEVDQPTRMERYYLMVTTGDEVLDYRVAVRRYAGAKQLVVLRGDHGFSTFAEHMDSVLDFAGMC